MNAFPWRLLDQTARTFAISLRMLPRPVREPLALAYLLARLSDTEADGAASPAEYQLLESRDLLLRLLQQSPDRADIEAVWSIIREGQAWDGRRFIPGAPPLSPAELERYTYLVAGCVGEFWTRLCHRKFPNWSRLDVEEMVRLGEEFGCGLQLVNILRDREEDARRGRVYVPDARRAIVIERARALLGSGRAYCQAVRGRRLRAAAALPLRLGMETLDLVEAYPEATRVKVTKARVYYHALLALAKGA